MENISHTLAGFALARAGLGGGRRLRTAALVVGSNLPDIDLLWSLRGGPAIYLGEHRGFTHSILGGALLALGLGTLLWAAECRLERPFRNGLSSRSAHLLASLNLSFLAVFLHLGFDFLNDYGLRPFLPFSDRWYYGDIVFIVDPWFWLLLGGGLHLSMPFQRRRVLFEILAWIGWGVLSIPVMLAQVVPAEARAIWVVGLLTLALLRALRAGAFKGLGGLGAGHAAWPAGEFMAPSAALLALVLYCLSLFSLHSLAKARASNQLARQQPVARRLAALPLPADPFHWKLIFEQGSTFFTGEVSAWPGGSDAAELERWESNLDLPEARAALGTPTGRAARGFCRYLFADIRHGPSGPVVAFRDARYASRGHDDWATFVVSLDTRINGGQ